ncbi:MAG TPA: (d)CMP kinase [Alphaproteobacteria bacterium]|nr:(d)CMP kinase [Rhodospirillaceae bacterium]HRJ11691.1 (d)CMP kinase [Alphaproteobacteria bacterium]
MPPLPIIAIDGPSAGGKGTIAKGIARVLNFAHLETGLLYRWVGKAWLERRDNSDDLETAAVIAQELADRFDLMLLNDPALRSNEVAEAASVISAHPPVRKALLELQRDFAVNPPGAAWGAILDGRDIGSVVCPDAPIKLFVTASPEIRAERRTKELQNLGLAATYEQVLAEVAARDERDRTRATAPLQTTAGSVEIDTSNLSAQESIDVALGIIRRTRLLPDE